MDGWVGRGCREKEKQEEVEWLLMSSKRKLKSK